MTPDEKFAFILFAVRGIMLGSPTDTLAYDGMLGLTVRLNASFEDIIRAMCMVTLELRPQG